MDAKTKALFEQALKEKVKLSDKSVTTSAEEKKLWEIFEEKPVSLTEFIQGEEYLNQPELVLSEPQYDLIRHMEQIYFEDTCLLMAEVWGEYWKPVRMVNTIVAAIGKGGGKDLCIQIAFARIAYLLICLRSPQKYYGAPDFTPIHMMNVATAAPQAQSVFFEPMLKMIRRSEWFSDKFAPGMPPPGPRSGVIHLKKGVELVSGHSQAESLEGRNLIAAVADEIDAFPNDSSSGDKTRTASYIVDMLQSSAATRFPLVYKLGLISFARTKEGYILSMLKTAKEDVEEFGDRSSYYPCGPYASWDFNPRFKRNHDFINIPQADVPVPNVPSIISAYKKDPGDAKGRYQCQPEASANAYFKDKGKVEQSFEREVDQPPLTVSYFFGKDNFDPNEKYASWQVHFTFSDDLKPVPGAVYAIHADMAQKEDRAGIAMCHVENYQTIETSDVHGEDREELRPVVKMDFATAFEYDAAAEDPDGNSVPREIQMRWYRKLVHELSARGFEIGSVSMDGFQCLSGDTTIPLLDGTSPTIEELVDREEPFYLYSLDTSTGCVVPGRAVRAFYSGAEDVYRVTLDNGEFVEATAGHPFMLRDGSFRNVSELVVGDSLMPLYTRDRKTSPRSALYQQVWHPGLEREKWKVGRRRWQFTHSMVNSYFNGPVPKGSLTHHIDWTKKNNDPSNLITMTLEDHAEVHCNNVALPLAKARFRELFDNDSEWREAHIAKISKAVGEANKSRLGRPQNRRKDITIDLITETTLRLAREGKSYSSKSVSVELGCTRDVVLHRVKHFADCDGRWSKFVANLGLRVVGNSVSKTDAPNNHKVVSVEYIGNKKTYDIEVDKYHNFAVGAGVFVHNSLDSLQIMEAWGYNAHRVSADIVSTQVWQTLRDLVYDGRFKGYRHKLLVKEMLSVEKTKKGKIDHPAGGSKDILDAVACSATMAVECGGSEEGEDIGDTSYFGAGMSMSNEFAIFGSGYADDFSINSSF